jgi:hypothetical protein
LETAKVQLLIGKERLPSDEKIREIIDTAIKEYGQCELEIDHCKITAAKERVTLKCKSDNPEILPLVVLEYCVYLLGNVRIFQKITEYKHG